ncbi:MULTISPECIES: 1,4-alpha-glucan branching protein GlgB [Gordonia]|uniref:1,4-alpha-glucan branching enzyme GlgB n=1 Tax=Gordonia sihwensis NBRC 108236 TaxID=1223544 RepID=L7LPF0_9ACTN|nr:MULTISPECIES: 1,4-alpha-glucan branching protein GlgB [Gordonia]MBY4570586.1 glycogen-branching enzyme [Gordonia sihwensis]GAC62794.1 1,4-alpha-glucan-branching enzyme [Gordonia sihwensis NBRC 108236]
MTDPLWQRLGARPRVADTEFAVWAPNARSVTVFGDFDRWAGTDHPMERGPHGVWTATVDGARPGMAYKYRVVGADGLTRDKADPLARAAQRPPETASVIAGPSSFVWNDEKWMAARADRRPEREPMSIYEVHLGSWRSGLSYREAAVQLAEYAADRGFTHVQLMPITEHPYGGSWGYQVGSYFACSSRWGTADDFRFFVDHLHSKGIAVLLDWVPAHFPKDAFALGEFDGTPLYEHADPLRRDQPDWGTYAFNLGRPEVRDFLIASAVYWCSEFHLDGLRVDAVASMLYLDYSRGPGQWRPNARGTHENDEAVDFLRRLNDAVHEACPGAVMIAEESTAWPGVTVSTDRGGLGFDFKWNLGWMNDLLSFLSLPPRRRAELHERVAFGLTHATAERYVLPISHDEVVHGKGTLVTRMPVSADAAAGVRLALAFQWAHPGKKLLFMGQEFGQTREWADDRGLDWNLLDPDGSNASVHRGIALAARDLAHLHAELPALHRMDCDARGFAWLDARDTANTVIGFLRLAGDGAATGGGIVACVFNFSDRDLDGYRLGFPLAGPWREILNTAAREYGGHGVGNLGRIVAVDEPSHGRPYSAAITLPASAAVFFTPGR